MNTIDIIRDVVKRNSNITGIYIHSFPNSLGLQRKLNFNSLEQNHYDSALWLRDKHNIPFWDALMLSFYNKSEFSERILENVLNSHANREKQFISREALLNGNLLDGLKDTEENYAFNSLVETSDGRRRHLLLLDFHIPEGRNNQVIAEKIIKLLQIRQGYLLRSGKSYHFIGKDLISTYGLISFISKCLFFTPVIDKSWIAHQLIDKSCSIRFTKKYGEFPSLIKSLEF